MKHKLGLSQRFLVICIRKQQCQEPPNISFDQLQNYKPLGFDVNLKFARKIVFENQVTQTSFKMGAKGTLWMSLKCWLRHRQLLSIVVLSQDIVTDDGAFVLGCDGFLTEEETLHTLKVCVCVCVRVPFTPIRKSGEVSNSSTKE